ncbi:MAG: 4-hydroxy-3-methylbut-2-enyl diphosphate reductase [Dehalococcoidia bacterium]
MKVLVTNPRGFCAGVVRAIDIVELAIKKFGEPVYVKHQIVHNPNVVNDVEQQGAITVEEIHEIPDGSVVIFSAHGSAPEDYKLANEKKLKIIDATCPLVTKVHNEAKKYSSQNKSIVIVGHEGHQEVKGTMGQTEMILIDERKKFPVNKIKDLKNVAVISQTTLSVNDTAKAIENIKEIIPDATVRNDICYATTNRQDATEILADKCDLVLVIGANNSSNCQRLKDVAIRKGVPSYLILGPEEINFDWLKGIETLGITSGASTPEKMVQEVIKAVKPNSVEYIGGPPEDITFKLPKELM